MPTQIKDGFLALYFVSPVYVNDNVIYGVLIGYQKHTNKLILPAQSKEIIGGG